MKLKPNNMLKLILPIAVLGAIFIGLKSCNVPSPNSDNQKAVSIAVADLTDEELQALGIDGDTAADTVATLVGQMKQYRRELQEIKTNNSTLLKENQLLRERELSVDTRIASALNSERDTLRGEMRTQQNSLIDEFQSRLEKLTSSNHLSGDLPIGLGLESSDLPDQSGNNIRWIEPQDAIHDDAQKSSPGFSFPTRFKSLDDSELGQDQKEFRAALKGERDLEDAKPVYTLPENSTLMGSVAMTALLGRVPINGTVTDPYPFKVLIGRDNLTANGIELPDVEGAVMSGSASGDWTLSCVRGNVHSITFVFRDGTVRTVPPASDKAQNSSDSQQSSVIGWISDPQGLPCVPGTRKSNAAEYIGSQFLLSGSAAAADAFANGNTTTVVDGSAVTTAVTGSSGQYVLGQMLGGGLKETSDWFKQRYGQMFDAVYVPPGHPIAIHISKQIPIDYEQQGRKVKYADATNINAELD